MLRIMDLDVYYGNIQVLKKVSLTIDDGKVIAIVGANGAGKTTLLRTISGLLKARNGSIEYNGEKLNNLSPEKIVEMGIAQVAEGRQLFPEMTVLENLELGAYTKRAADKMEDTLEYVFQLLPKLLNRRKQVAGTLSGGEQQMVAIGRALMSQPELLMLDEPSLGLAPKIVTTVFDTIKEIAKNGTTIMLVEQNLSQSLELADFGYVLENGNVVIEGKADDVLNNPYTRKAYLGL